jgi:hypothetical protein
MTGATMYTHRESSLAPMTADAIDRAGFTDEPVNGTIAKWMTSRVSGMANAAWVGVRFVEVRMTAMKIAVKTVSMITAWMSLIPLPGTVAVPATLAWLDIVRTRAAAAIPPMSWETT